jgi:hypothetical protein
MPDTTTNAPDGLRIPDALRGRPKRRRFLVAFPDGSVEPLVDWARRHWPRRDWPGLQSSPHPKHIAAWLRSEGWKQCQVDYNVILWNH